MAGDKVGLQPRRKHKRVSVACGPCVRAKVRCDSGRPCSRCRTRNSANMCIDRAEVHTRKKVSRIGRGRRACLHCHRDKTSCDTYRPCKRCFSRGIVCTDRGVEISKSCPLSLVPYQIVPPLKEAHMPVLCALKDVWRFGYMKFSSSTIAQFVSTGKHEVFMALLRHFLKAEELDGLRQNLLSARADDNTACLMLEDSQQCDSLFSLEDHLSFDRPLSDSLWDFPNHSDSPLSDGPLGVTIPSASPISLQDEHPISMESFAFDSPSSLDRLVDRPFLEAGSRATSSSVVPGSRSDKNHVNWDVITSQFLKLDISEYPTVSLDFTFRDGVFHADCSFNDNLQKLLGYSDECIQGAFTESLSQGIGIPFLWRIWHPECHPLIAQEVLQMWFLSRTEFQLDCLAIRADGQSVPVRADWKFVLDPQTSLFRSSVITLVPS